MSYPDVNQRGKIQWLNYDWIFSQSTEECSFCLTQREVQTILSMLETVAWKNRWYSPADAEIGQDEIEALRDNLERKLMNNCCSDTITELRLNDDGSTEISTDGGTTWVDNPDDPRNSGVQYPPLPGTDGDDKKCKGANNAREFIEDAVNSFGDTVTTISGLFGVAGAMVLIILAVFSVTVGFLPLVPLFLTLAAAVIAAGKDAYLAEFSGGIYDDLTCIFYCHIEDDGSFTNAAITAILTDIDTEFTGNVALTFTSQVKALQALGMTNAARTGLSEEIDCAGCSCGDGCDVDNWHIYGTEEGEGTDIYGTEISRDSVSITAEASLLFGSYWVILWTSNPSLCCVAFPTEVIEGDLGGTQAWIPCGGDFPVTSGAMGDSRCIYLYQINDESPFKVKVTFQTCP